MRVFLTGANGYVGSLLSERLAQSPVIKAITGIGLKPPSRALPPKMTFKVADIRSADLGDLMRGHDIVVNTACVVLWPASMPVKERDDINLNGVRNVAEAARVNGIRRFVHASSMAAYDPQMANGRTDITEDFPLGEGRSPFYYWNAKAAAERTLTEILGSTSTVLTLLRPIYIIGPRNRPLIKMYRKNAVNFPGRNPRRQFIHEEDVAAAFLHAVGTDMPGAYNVVPDDFVRLTDVWRIVGKRIVPTLPVWMACAISRIRWRYLGSTIHPSWVRDMLVDFTGSNVRLKNAGWKPRFRSDEAIGTAL